MNDKDRDRSGDGAGPVDPLIRRNSNSRSSVRLWAAAVLLAFGTGAQAQGAQGDYLRGLSFSISAGAMRASDIHANFYNGNPTNDNTIDRVLYSEAYGNTIWNDLVNQGLISPSAIGSYHQLQVVEYGNMHYRPAIQIGLGFRYDYDNQWGWLAHFDYSKLHAVGAFNLSSTNGTGILSNVGQYVTCAIAGAEERIYIDFGLSKKVRLENGFDLGFEFGASMNNTKVESNDMQIAGATYSILDRWNGESPSIYGYTYEYINQGGVGFGGFGSVNYSLTLPNHSAITAGYTVYYTKINLSKYESMGLQHLLFLRFDMNDFSFFD